MIAMKEDDEVALEKENKEIVRRYKALLRSSSETTREDKKLIRKA